ncbi:MAG: branched-chain amino acid ABC transporter substrate-binding protein [Candidatus Hydrogenedentota bacterium]|nr:MAG: branched-chain amino acid ABC transporter substrate-binding protein [Candidatus Hydrogenedentota bacterium]
MRKLRGWRTWIAVTAGILATVLSFGCGGGKSGRGTPAPSTGNTIYIGVAGPMTGDLAQFGESLRNGVTLAFDEINSAGGVLGKKLEIVVGDDQAKTNEGVNVARNFARDPRGIVAVLGHFNSGISKPAGEIYNKKGIVMLTPASTNPGVTGPDKPFVFRNLPNDNQNGELLAQFVVEGLKAKRIAIYFANDEYGKGLAKVVARKAKALGAEVVDQAKYDPNADEDFRPVLTKWKGLNLDAVVLAAENPKGAQLIKQAREIGLETPFAGGDGIASSELWKIGGQAADGVYVVSYFHPGNPDPAVQEFVKKYEKRFGRKADVWAAQAYDAARVLADAIRRAGSTDRKAIRDALAATDGWKGVTGPHRFKNGDAIGKRVIITRVEKKESGEYHFAFFKEVGAEEAR